MTETCRSVVNMHRRGKNKLFTDGRLRKKHPLKFGQRVKLADLIQDIPPVFVVASFTDTIYP